MTSYLPATVDGRDIPLEAPRSQGMDDTQAAVLTDHADTYHDTVLHLHADVAGSDLSLSAANCPAGPVIFGFGDGTGETVEAVDGTDPTVTHTYLTDGVFTASVDTGTDRAFVEVAVNWPPYEQESP